MGARESENEDATLAHESAITHIPDAPKGRFARSLTPAYGNRQGNSRITNRDMIERIEKRLLPASRHGWKPMRSLEKEIVLKSFGRAG
ncbi:hypothetical protein [Caballeronia sp. HLA56]